jgi:hypothetical protein
MNQSGINEHAHIAALREHNSDRLNKFGMRLNAVLRLPRGRRQFAQVHLKSPPEGKRGLKVVPVNIAVVDLGRPAIHPLSSIAL